MISSFKSSIVLVLLLALESLSWQVDVSGSSTELPNGALYLRLSILPDRDGLDFANFTGILSNQQLCNISLGEVNTTSIDESFQVKCWLGAPLNENEGTGLNFTLVPPNEIQTVSFGVTLVPKPRMDSVYPAFDGYAPPTITIIGQYFSNEKQDLDVSLQSSSGESLDCRVGHTSETFVACALPSYPGFESGRISLSRLGAASEPVSVSFPQPERPVAEPTSPTAYADAPVETTHPTAPFAEATLIKPIFDDVKINDSLPIELSLPEQPAVPSQDVEQPSNSEQSGPPSGLSGMTILGIVLGAVFGLGLIALLLTVHALRKATRKSSS